MNGRKIRKFVLLRLKIDSCLIDDDCVDKKAKDTKKCIIKGQLKFKDYKDVWGKRKQCWNNSKWVRRKMYSQRQPARLYWVEVITKYDIWWNCPIFILANAVHSRLFGIHKNERLNIKTNFDKKKLTLRRKQTGL